MRHVNPHPRGMALVMAMIVVVLITLLVAGAISFTGTERAASEVQAEDAAMSACVQAARNMFISRVNQSDVTQINRQDPQPDVDKITAFKFDEDMGFLDTSKGDHPTKLRSGHLGQPSLVSAKVATGLSDPNEQINNIDGAGFPDKSPAPIFFTVTAVCREDANDPSSPEREIEFLVRVGF